MGVGKRRNYGVTRVHAVGECKSMTGFHVISSEWKSSYEDDQYTFSWFGGIKENRDYLAKILIECEIPPASINYLMQKFDLWFPPNQPKSIFELQFDPFGGWPGCSGFKETSIGSEKDLDNSVIWRASLALKSAVTSFINLHNEEHRYDYLTTFRGTPKRSFPQNHKDLVKHFNKYVNIVDIYHPFIVTDANLWISDEKGLRKTDVLRIYERQIMDEIGWWFDVVTYKYAKEYVDGLCTHYIGEARKRRMVKYM